MRTRKKQTKLKQINYLTRFVFRAFLIAILCLLVGFGVVLAIYLGDLVLNSNNPNKKPLFSTYVVLTPSMVPTINVNDAIIVKRVDKDNYKVGDIITFNSNEENYEGLAITHRVVEKQEINDNTSVYTTKGDNNKIIDPTSVKTDSIYGKVLFKIPKVGYIQKFFSSPINYLLCLLVPATIFISYNISKITILMKKRRKKYI